MTDTLKHVGILGMRWGHRSSSSKSHPSKDHAIASRIKAKKLSEMSNDEINTLSKRIQLEKQYKDLNPGKVARGAKHVDNVMSTLGKVALGIGTITTLAAAGQKYLSPVLKSRKVRKSLLLLEAPKAIYG